MSDPGRSPTDDFMATRGAAGKGSDAWMLQLAGGGGSGAQTAAPGASPAAPAPAAGGSGRTAAPPPASTLPFGLQMSQMVSNAWQGAKKAFLQPGADSWDALKRDFIASQPDKDKWQGASFWGRLKQSWDQQMASGRMAVDAFNLALSPLTGAANVATTTGGKVVHAVAPFIPEDKAKEMLDQAMLGLGPEGGALGEAAAAGAKGAGAAKVGEGLENLGAPKPVKMPPGSGPDWQAPNAKGAAEATGGAPEATGEGLEGGKPEARAFDLAGAEPGAALKVTPQVRQQAADFLAGKRDNPIQVHLDTLADPETRGEAVNQIAKVIPKDAVKGLDISEMGAYSLNLTPTELMQAIRPKFASDETFMAAAMAQNSGAEVFWNAARRAVETNAPEDVEAATRAYAHFNEFTGALRDAKTDWGRAGRAQQVAMRSRDDFTKHIQSVVEDLGQDKIEEVIRKVADLDDPRKVSPFVSSLRWMTSRDGFLYGWYNWLISHAVIGKKLVSDASLASFNIGTRYWAEKFGASGAVAPGETAALVQGYLGSMKDAIRAAGKALKGGQSQFYGDYQSLFDGQFFDRGSRLADATPEGINGTSVTQAALEYLRMALPTSAIAAADDFAKVANYRAEIHALAFREASQRVALRASAATKGAKAGNLSDASFEEHFHDLVNNVQPEMHEQAVSNALRNTLQEPLDGLAASLQEALDKFNIPIRGTSVEIPLGRILIPFTKISTNSLRMAYRSSPLPLAFPSAGFRAAIAAGGAKRDLALAQAGLGTAVSMITVMLAVGGKLSGSGPTSPDLRRAWLAQGGKPYHLELGGVHVPYEHIEPLATTLGTVADTVDLMRYANDEDNAQLATSLSLGIGHAMLDKTYLTTVSQLMEAMEAPDQKGQRFAENFLSGLALPGDVSMVQRAIDPWVRSHNDLMSTIAARTPGFSKDLPPQRTLWGAPLPRENDWIPALSQAATQAAGFAPPDHAEPIDKWIWAHRDAFPESDMGRLGLTTPPRTLTFDVGQGDPVHVPMTLQQIDRLRVLAGNETKGRGGLGAKDGLNALVEGRHPDAALQAQWNKSTPQRQALTVLNMWGNYRSAAKAQLLHEDAGLRDQVAQARDGRRALIAPTIGAQP